MGEGLTYTWQVGEDTWQVNLVIIISLTGFNGISNFFCNC